MTTTTTSTIQKEEKSIDVGDGVMARTESYRICTDRSGSSSSSSSSSSNEQKGTAAAAAPAVAPLLVMLNMAPGSFIDKLLLGPTESAHDHIIIQCNTNNTNDSRTPSSISSSTRNTDADDGNDANAYGNNNNIEIELATTTNNKIRCADFIVSYDIYDDNVTTGSFLDHHQKRGGGGRREKASNTDGGIIEILAKHIVKVMNSYGYDKFHVLSSFWLGGIVIQYLMIHHASNIISSTIMSSTPLSIGSTNGLTKMIKPDPNGRKEIEDVLLRDIHLEKMMENVQAVKRLENSAVAELDGDITGIAQFDSWKRVLELAVRSTPIDRRPLLRKTTTPCLVVHGKDNGLFPYEHGVALAEAIPGSELLTIEGGTINMMTDPTHYNAIIERVLALIYDCTEREQQQLYRSSRDDDSSANTTTMAVILPPRFSINYTGFGLDIQTVSNAITGEWKTRENLTGSIISQSSKTTHHFNPGSFVSNDSSASNYDGEHAT